MFDEPGLRYSHQAMRTTFTLFFPTDEPNTRLGIAEDCLSEIVDIELAISPYQEGSDIHRLNTSAGNGEWIRIAWPTYSLLQLCVQLMNQTKGSFNPFNGRHTMRVSGKILDSHTEGLLQELTDHVSPANAVIEFSDTRPECRLTKNTLIDLGAIGKGWALDKCKALIIDAGVERAFISAGGSSMIAIGKNWPVQIAGIDKSIRLCDQALSVSRRINPDAGGIHIVGENSLDPRDDLVSLVIGDSCAVTDALSTGAAARGEVVNNSVHGYDVSTKMFSLTNTHPSQ